MIINTMFIATTYNKINREEYMKNKLWNMSSIIALIILIFAISSFGGNLEPAAPPGPTMRTLDDIYNAVNTSNSLNLGNIKSFFIVLNSDTNYAHPTIIDIYTVAEGKSVVLTDILIAHGGGGDAWLSIYENNIKKTIVSAPTLSHIFNEHVSLDTGIPFASGSKISVSLYGTGTNVTLTGYEY